MSDPSPQDPIAHRKLALLETADESTLDRLYADGDLLPHLWLRLDPRRALVDPLTVDALVKRLEALELPAQLSVDASDRRPSD